MALGSRGRGSNRAPSPILVSIRSVNLWVRSTWTAAKRAIEDSARREEERYPYGRAPYPLMDHEWEEIQREDRARDWDEDNRRKE